MSRRGESKIFILSVVGRIFDPIGILGPFVIKLKCLLQELWTLGVEWDTELPQKLRHKWQQWSREAEGLTEIKIPRFYLGNIDQEISKREIHCFSDASKSAYGTILYLRFVTCNNEIETSFICSKSRIAPLKSLTLPRLELTAALLSARLAKQVSSCLKFDANIYYWTDSLISYYWIRGDFSAFKPLTYVKNDPGEPEQLTPAHFLELGYGDSKYPIHFIELIDATTAKESYKKRKAYRTLLLKQLWRRWKEQYLLQLKTANHFKTPSVHKNLKLNDVVLVEKNVKSKLLWELGIIKEIFIGRDNNVRSCLVKTFKGLFKKPIQLLYPLEIV
ncbi:integrase catalytic domain-containing protein [Trichonephila clavipes]|nr:integrase catalytic domain-containing protein [Trichonephila clavipes]